MRWTFIIISLLIVSCTTKPEPLVAGKDACVHCKMPVADTRFGSEIISDKGRIYKFDDINCMLQWSRQSSNINAGSANFYVVNYFDQIDLMNAADAVYLKSDNLRTPMNSGFAAFANKEDAEKLLKDDGGVLVDWNFVQNEIK